MKQVLLAAVFAFSQWSSAFEIVQLTGRPGFPSSADFGDPSPPDFSYPGEVRVYTTGGEMLAWRGKSALDSFLHGRAPLHRKLDLYHSDGVTALDPLGAGEDAWDPTVELIDGIRYLFAGAMFREPGEKHAYWPGDHWSRRTFMFREVGSRWVMENNSLFGAVLGAIVVLFVVQMIRGNRSITAR